MDNIGYMNFKPYFSPYYASVFSTPNFTCLNPLRKNIRPIVKKKQLNLKRREKGKGKWNYDEQRLYIQFLEKYHQEMASKTLRKSFKVFLKMSRKIQSRSADQCRSHHQKILIYHSSIERIIQYYKNTIFPEYSNQIIRNQVQRDKNKKECKESQNQFVQVTITGRTIKLLINADLIAKY